MLNAVLSRFLVATRFAIILRGHCVQEREIPACLILHDDVLCYGVSCLAGLREISACLSLHDDLYVMVSAVKWSEKSLTFLIHEARS